MTRHFREFEKGKDTSTNSIASIFAWTRGLAHRAKLDDNKQLADFCTTLERSCIETVRGGVMTKDLALSIYGKNLERKHYVDSLGFIDEVAKKLKSELEKTSKLWP